MSLKNRRSGVDACPGALDVHQAADGGLARVRLPGGRVTSAQLRVLAAASAELGCGGLELTSRANVQIRGLGPDGPVELGARLAAAGLLPSLSHEKVRNIMSSPLPRRGAAAVDAAGVDAAEVGPAGLGAAEVGPAGLGAAGVGTAGLGAAGVGTAGLGAAGVGTAGFGAAGVDAAVLDAALCADPVLAALPGRFLFALDSGVGDVAWLGADVAALPVGGRWAILLGGQDHGVRVAEPVAAMLAAARAFLEIRDGQWRIAELGDQVAEIVERLGASPARIAPGRPPTAGPLGDLGGAAGAAVPLGRLDDRQLAVLAAAPHVVITPWRGVVVPGATAAELAAVGLVVDPADPAIGVTACTGRPGCAKALADVRADALRVARPGRPVHFAGCARRCGRPAGDVVDVVAVDGGYEVDGRPVSGDVVAEVRQEQR
ncbi:precorrin-3B synthase [Actinokineospora sp. NPDC004072]